MQQLCPKTIDVHFNHNAHFNHNDAFTVSIIIKQFQQLTSKVNMPTGINTCNNRDYDLTEVLNSQRGCAS